MYVNRMGMWKTKVIQTYEAPWRNAWARNRYVQYCKPDELESLSPKLFRIIKLYGEAFDDYWFYWITRSEAYIKRSPIWFGQKSVDAEKPKKYEPNRKLEEFQDVRT